MKRLLIFSFILYVCGLHAQSSEMPLGVQVTPAFQVPPVTASTFNTRFPGITASWAPHGEHYAATFKRVENNLPVQMVFDRNGILLAQYEQLNKKEYPKNIDHFFEVNYPDEQYIIWRQADSTGIRNYFSVKTDTMWFDRNGRYTWILNERNYSLSETDLHLLTQTASMHMLDVTLAQLALVNAASPEVKNLAATRSKNNFEMHRDLKKLTAPKHVNLPTELSQSQQKKLAEFNGKQGAEFDKAYTHYLIKEDKKHLSRLKRASRNAEDPDVKKWIENARSLAGENARLANQAYCSVK
jgi:predicted outer membrane protein